MTVTLAERLGPSLTHPLAPVRVVRAEERSMRIVMMVTALPLFLLIVTGVNGQPVLLLVLGLESERKAPVSRWTLNTKERNVQKARRSPVIEMFHVPLTASRFGLTGPVVTAGRVKRGGRERSSLKLLTKEGIVIRRKRRKRNASVRPKKDPQGWWWWLWC